MPDQRATNRTMFWRIVRRLLAAHRGRLFVILLALGAGAAVTAALLNLQVDAKRRLTSEFRVFGANIVVAPRQTSNSTGTTLDEAVLQQIPAVLQGQHVGVQAVLYVASEAGGPGQGVPIHVVVAGESRDTVDPEIARKLASFSSEPLCQVGVRAAAKLRVNAQPLAAVLTGTFGLLNGGHREVCQFAGLRSSGGPEDDQIIVPLDVAQRLAGLPGKVSLVQISAPGTPAAIDAYIAELAGRIPDADIRPVRQFTEAEGKIYNRISGLLTATVAVVLILTALCVMAAMTNVAMERKNDVGLMKAIGGATRRVLRLFLAEAALLGLIAGTLGAAAGIGLSIWLGQAVFGVAARPRLIVYPVAVALTIIVAIAGAYPLRRLATIRPASVFRGEA